VRSQGRYVPDGDTVRVINRLSANDLRAVDVVLTGRRATRSRMNTLCPLAHEISSPLPLPLPGEPLVCLSNTPKYGLFHGAIYYAWRDLQEGNKTISINTDNGDVEVHAHFLAPGRADEKPDPPPGRWMAAFTFGYAMIVHKAQGSEFDTPLLIDEWCGDDRAQWLCAAITHAKQRSTIATKDPQP
jgi:exodeoxyribonuclease-5